MSPRSTGLRPLTLAALASIATLTPMDVRAQGTLFPEYSIDDSTSRPEAETPEWVDELERTEGVPPCDGRAYWGRSTLDGGLASRRRPADLPCRNIWRSTVRFELGLSGGGLLDRGDGGIGGLSLQLGLRLHEYFSVYYQGHVLGGGWDRGVGTTVEGASWHGLMFEMQPHEVFALALGPSMDVAGGCDIDVDQVPLACGYAWAYGLGSRVTFALGDGPIDGSGLVTTFDFHVSLLEPDPRGVALLGLGLRL